MAVRALTVKRELARAPAKRALLPTLRLRHRFTTFWRMGNTIHNFWRGRFTTWAPRFTTRFTTFWAGPRRNEKGNGDLSSRDRHSHGCSQVRPSPLCRLPPLTYPLAFTIHRTVPLWQFTQTPPGHSPTSSAAASAYSSTKITVTSNIPFSKRYLKYLTKKFLRKGSLRGPGFW
jgi:hypothetical protein